MRRGGDSHRLPSGGVGQLDDVLEPRARDGNEVQ
jgi:hypothetical protein